MMILFTQSTAVLHKYLNDALKYFVCYNFFLRLHRIHRIPWEFPDFSMFREIPKYSRFSRFVATLWKMTYGQTTCRNRWKRSSAEPPNNKNKFFALCQPHSLLTSTQYWNMSHLVRVLYALLAPIYYLSPCLHRFWVLQFLCSCSHHLEFPSLGYLKQFYHILFLPPTQNLLSQSSFSASLVPHPTASPAPQIRLANCQYCALYKFIYLLTYLITQKQQIMFMYFCKL